MLAYYQLMYYSGLGRGRRMKIVSSQYCPMYAPLRKPWCFRWVPNWWFKRRVIFYYIVDSDTYICNPLIYKMLETNMKGKVNGR